MTEARSATSPKTPSVPDKGFKVQRETNSEAKDTKFKDKKDHLSRRSSIHDIPVNGTAASNTTDKYLPFPGETDDFEKNLLSIRPINPFDAVESEYDNCAGLILTLADLDKLYQIFPSWADGCFDLDELPRLGTLRSAYHKKERKERDDAGRMKNSAGSSSSEDNNGGWDLNETRNLWEVDANRWPAPVRSMNAKVHWSSITVSTLENYPGVDFLTFSAEGYMSDMKSAWSEQVKLWKLELSKSRSIPFFVWAMNFEKKLISSNLDFFLTHNFLKMGSVRITPLHVAENDFINHGIIGQLFPNVKLSLSAYDTWREIKSSHLKGHPEKLIQVILNNFLMNRFTRDFHINNCITKINSIRYCIHGPPYPEVEIKRELLKKFRGVYAKATEISQRAKLSINTPLQDIIKTIDLISLHNSTNKTVTLPSGELLMGTAGDLSPEDAYYSPNSTSGPSTTSLVGSFDSSSNQYKGTATRVTSATLPISPPSAPHNHNKVVKPSGTRNDTSRLDDRQQNHLRDEMNKLITLDERKYSSSHSGWRYNNGHTGNEGGGGGGGDDRGTYNSAYFI